MGFGTLFFGYFLLLNITYNLYTDVIAGVIMLLAFYKLSGVNRYFKYAMYTSAAFSVYGLFELSLGAVDIFFPLMKIEWLLPYVSIFRSVIVAGLTVLMLKAMYEVAKEVELEKIPDRCKVMIPVAMFIYLLRIALEAPVTVSLIPSTVLAVLYLIIIIGTMATVLINLFIIYGCYMRICMPGEEEPKEKPSRFAFVNEYRRRQAEKRKQEEAERLERAKRKRKKKGK